MKVEQLNAIAVMKEELQKILKAQTECLNKHGFIKQTHMYRYMILIDRAKAFRDSIDWLMANVYND